MQMSQEVYTPVDPSFATGQTTVVPPTLSTEALLRSWMAGQHFTDDHQAPIIIRFGKCIDCLPSPCTCNDAQDPCGRDSYPDHLPDFPMGNCLCGSAGTVGYTCVECGLHEYSHTWYPRRNNQLVPVDYMHFALALGKKCWVIIPPNDINVMTSKYDYYLTTGNIQRLGEWEESVARQEQANHNIRMTEKLLHALRSGVPYTAFPCRLDESGNWINQQTGANTSAIEIFHLNTSTAQFLSP